MKHSCPHCGKEINPAKMLGGVRTPKKEAAWKANGERLKKMYANARKVGETNFGGAARKDELGARDSGKGPMRDPEQPVSSPAPATPFIAPKGSFSKEDLKAIMNLDRSGTLKPDWREIAVADLNDTPCAPFDFKDEEGNLHRVRAYGKTLKVCFLRDGVEEPIRNLREGELEQLWERRIK